VKRTEEFLTASWIVLYKFLRGESSISEITTPPTRNLHFAKYFFALFEDSDFKIRTILSGINSGEEACSSSTDND